MKQPGEELQETVTELDDSAVVDYLLNNPEFFIRNARVVEQMRVRIRFAGPCRWSNGTWRARVTKSTSLKRT